jgi:hypothetical protein
MGRGRAKAKQTKVARELKYHSPTTDLAALQRELGSSSNHHYDEISEQDGAFADEDDDEFEDDEDDETPNWSRGSR